jgi:NADH-quinone oxidoreductase subunit J
MVEVFYIAGAVAIVATFLMLTRLNAVHALLYLIVSLLAVAVVFYTLGAPFIAALEVIVYAGAIMVLFIFVVMMLNLGPPTTRQEKAWLTPGIWRGPAILALILISEIAYVIFRGTHQPFQTVVVEPKQVGLTLFGPYLIGVELASMLLLAGLVGAYHLGSKNMGPKREIQHDVGTLESRPAPGGDLVRAGTDRASRSS